MNLQQPICRTTHRRNRPRAILTYFPFPFDPQISTPASLRRQKRLPAPAERIQDQIASLAERLDQLLGKAQREDRRVIKTRLVAADICDDHVADPCNTVRASRRLTTVAAAVAPTPNRSDPSKPTRSDSLPHALRSAVGLRDFG